MKKVVTSCWFVFPLIAVAIMIGGCTTPSRFENESKFYLPVGHSVAEVPSGLRRTKNGWEDTSMWHVSQELPSRSIESWMDHQRSREPGWVRQLFHEIRTTPPLMVAVLQITAIAAIVHISRAQKVEPRG